MALYNEVKDRIALYFHQPFIYSDDELKAAEQLFDDMSLVHYR